MRIIHALFALVALPVATFVGPACTLVVAGVDDYVEAPTVGDGGEGGINGDTEGGSTSLFQSLRMELIAMKPHNLRYFELRIVDSSNFIQCKMILDPPKTDDVSFFVPNAVPNEGGPYRLDFFGPQQDGKRTYTGVGSITDDHAWRIGPPLADYPKGVSVEPGVIHITFVHDTKFKDIDVPPGAAPNEKSPSRNVGNDIVVNFSNMGIYLGKQLQYRVINQRSGQTIALYRLPSILTPDFTAIVPGMADITVDYNIEIWIDANGNDAFDAPTTGIDAGWRILKTSTDKTLHLDFDPGSFPEKKAPIKTF